jgi:DNA-binding beta-propeller fold protein YncE
MDPQHRGHVMVLATAMLIGVSVSAVAVSLAEATPQLLVSGGNTDSVLEYDGSSRAFDTTFVPAGSGGLQDPVGLVFGPNGNLFVRSEGKNRVLKYNGSTGALDTAFVPAGSGGLSGPTFLTFTSDPTSRAPSSSCSPAESGSPCGVAADRCGPDDLGGRQRVRNELRSDQCDAARQPLSRLAQDFSRARAAPSSA